METTTTPPTETTETTETSRLAWIKPKMTVSLPAKELASFTAFVDDIDGVRNITSLVMFLLAERKQFDTLTSELVNQLETVKILNSELENHCKELKQANKPSLPTPSAPPPPVPLAPPLPIPPPVPVKQKQNFVGMLNMLENGK